jgi:hypothetical protein
MRSLTRRAMGQHRDHRHPEADATESKGRIPQVMSMCITLSIRMKDKGGITPLLDRIRRKRAGCASDIVTTMDHPTKIDRPHDPTSCKSHGRPDQGRPGRE